MEAVVLSTSPGNLQGTIYQIRHGVLKSVHSSSLHTIQSTPLSCALADIRTFALASQLGMRHKCLSKETENRIINFNYPLHFSNKFLDFLRT